MVDFIVKEAPWLPPTNPDQNHFMFHVSKNILLLHWQFPVNSRPWSSLKTAKYLRHWCALYNNVQSCMFACTVFCRSRKTHKKAPQSSICMFPYNSYRHSTTEEGHTMRLRHVQLCPMMIWKMASHICRALFPNDCMTLFCFEYFGDPQWACLIVSTSHWTRSIGKGAHYTWNLCAVSIIQIGNRAAIINNRHTQKKIWTCRLQLMSFISISHELWMHQPHGAITYNIICLIEFMIEKWYKNIHHMCDSSSSRSNLAHNFFSRHNIHYFIDRSHSFTFVQSRHTAAYRWLRIQI